MHAPPMQRDLVLIGGGHSHALALRMWAMAPLRDVRVTLISPQPDTPYSGMLPGLIAGYYRFHDTHIDLAQLCRHAGAGFIQAAVTGVCLETNTIALQDRPAIEFDLLSINSGIAPDMSVPGAADHAIPVKPIASFYPQFRALLSELHAQPAGSAPRRILIVGGGAAATELAFAFYTATRPSADITVAPLIEIVHPGDALPEHYPRALQRKTGQRLEHCAIRCHAGQRVIAVASDHVMAETRTGQQQQIAFDRLIWTTQAAPSFWPAASGLSHKGGFIAVDDTLRSISHPQVFAAGDIAVQQSQPRPRAGVFAVRQARTLFHNWQASLQQQPLQAYRPQRAYLSLLACDDRYAVGCRRHQPLPAVSGRWVWRWKDHIDRRFMAQFQNLNPMSIQQGGKQQSNLVATDADAMHCGGCGAKVGAALLDRVLDKLPVHDRAGLDRRDDASVLTIPPNQQLIQSVDQFRQLIDDLWLLGRIAALHALSDLFAMFATPHSAQAILTLPWAHERLVERDLWQLLHGAVTELNRHGCALVGGHTSEGAELGIGFAVNGIRDDGPPPAPPDAGDALIVTKALGVGALFAAHQQCRAAGADISGAIEMMLQSNAGAADIFQQHGANLCTDITGFGLLGHLQRTLAPSGLSAELNLQAIPQLNGARECIDAGFVSSLQPQNMQFDRFVDCEAALRDTPDYQLLFDPQTAGGLLACVPAQQLETCLSDLRVNGYADSMLIGRINGDTGGQITIRKS